jgi:nucleoside-diphosphate-sugar epimerase
VRIVVTGGSGLVGRSVLRRLAPNHEIVNVDLNEPDSPVGRHVRADVSDSAAVRAAVDGADAVVHAAALPGPGFGTEAEIDRVNVGGTQVVARAALARGVRRFIFVSSEAVLGFVFTGGRSRPLYFPIDEAHPLSPSESYGRSKLSAEVFLRREVAGRMTIVSLRPPWVWVPEEYEKCRSLTADPGAWSDGLWAYVHGDDLARAVELAIGADLPAGYHAVYVAAADNGTVVPTRELTRRYYPGVPFRGDVAEFGSLISSRGARDLLGYEPQFRWREFLGEP